MKNTTTILQTSLKWFVWGLSFMLWIVFVVYASSIALNELWNKSDWDNLTLDMWNSLVHHVQDLKSDLENVETTPGPAGPAWPTWPQGPAGPVNIVQSMGTSTTHVPSQNAVNTAMNLKANIASPNFTGTPTAPTPAAWANNTQIATTQWVNANTASASSNSWQCDLGSSNSMSVCINPSCGTSCWQRNIGDYSNVSRLWSCVWNTTSRQTHTIHATPQCR